MGNQLKVGMIGCGEAVQALHVPALNSLTVVFGLLQIVWFIWLGIVMLRTRPGAGA